MIAHSCTKTKDDGDGLLTSIWKKSNKRVLAAPSNLLTGLIQVRKKEEKEMSPGDMHALNSVHTHLVSR